jgi:hypothetical protein
MTTDHYKNEKFILKNKVYRSWADPTRLQGILDGFYPVDISYAANSTSRSKWCACCTQ